MGGEIYTPMKRCTTHHHACDCRERDFSRLIDLAHEVMIEHAPEHDLVEWSQLVEALTGKLPETLTDP